MNYDTGDFDWIKLSLYPQASNNVVVFSLPITLSVVVFLFCFFWGGAGRELAKYHAPLHYSMLFRSLPIVIPFVDTFTGIPKNTKIHGEREIATKADTLKTEF